jgi:hypothetical protein
MKHFLFFLIIVGIASVITSCGPTDKSMPEVKVPQGTFIGQFRLLHRKIGQVKFDTTKANITVTMGAGKIYNVTGDTAVVHAGSHGTFSMDPQYILFTDATYPKTGIPTKTHLNGGYLYYFDGTVFQMLAYSVDTLALQYDLKRQGAN